jgi:hypothetical protein
MCLQKGKRGRGMTRTFELYPQMGRLRLRRVPHVLCRRHHEPLLFDLTLGILYILDGVLLLLCGREHR